MKKVILLISLCGVMLLSSCGTRAVAPSPSPIVSPTQTAVSPTMSPTAQPVKYINATTKQVSTDKWSVLGEYKFDIDGDGNSENIKLTTSAQKDDKGNVMWDDGQDWALEMIDGKDIYILYSGRIQQGRAYFEVFQDSKLKGTYVRLLVSSGSSFIVKEFEYVKDKKAFLEGSNVSNIDKAQNKLYSSIPEYGE